MAVEETGLRLVVENAEQFQTALEDGSAAVESFSAAGQKTEGAFEGFQAVVTGALLKVGAVAVETLLAAGKAVLDFGANAFAGAVEAEKGLSMLEGAIKRAGDAAPVTIDQAQELADKFKDLAGGSDDAVMAAETVLLRFQGIGQHTFPTALQAALDLSAALGVDLTSASQMVGKALESPGEGLARLKVAGVAFTDEQEKLIKSLVESGQTAEAQQIILNELARTTGGAAADAAQTFGGQMAILKEYVADAAETVAGKFLPVLEDLFKKYIEPNLPLLAEWADWLGNQIPVAVEWLGEKFQEAQPYLKVLAETLQYLVQQFTDKFPLVKAEAEKVFAAFQQRFGDDLPRIFHDVIEILDMVGKFWQQHGDTIIRVTSAVFQTLLTVADVFMNTFGGIFSAGLHLLQGDWQGAFEILGGISRKNTDSILSAFGVSMDSLTLIFKNWWVEFYAVWLQRWLNLKNWLNNTWVTIKNLAIDTWNRIGDGIERAADDISLAVRNGIQTAYDWARFWWSKVVAIFTDPAERQRLFQSAINWVQGFIDGLWQKANSLWQAIRDIFNRVVQTIKDILGIHSPSALGFALGANFGGAFGLGMREALQGVTLDAMAQVAAPGGAMAPVGNTSYMSSTSYAPSLTIHSPAPANVGMSFAMLNALASNPTQA